MRPRLRRAAGGGDCACDAATPQPQRRLGPLSAAAAALAAGGAHLARAADAAANALARAGAASQRRAPPPCAAQHAPPCRRAPLPFASLSARLAGDDAPARLTRRRQRGADAAPPLVFVSAASNLSALQPATAARTPTDADAAEPAEPADATEPDAEGGATGAGGAPQAAPREERILISEVEIKGVSGELAALARAALTIKPNFAYTLEEVQEDVNRVFQTGYFSNCQPLAEDTRDGVRVTLDVRPNPELRGVVVNGANVLPVRVIADAFAGQYSRTLNFGAFNVALQAINSWYEERGIFGQVVDADLSEGGICELKVTEAMVSKVHVRTLSKDSGEPVAAPRTRPEVITRALTTRPGMVYSVRTARRDLDSVYSTGIFEDVSLVPTPSAEEPGKLDLTVNVVEKRTGGFSAGGGMSARGLAEGALSGMVGSCAYTQKNLFGLNQKLTASVELGQVDSLFRVSHVDPWVRSDAYRTSRVVTVQNTRSNGNAIHGRGPEPPSPEQAAAAAAAGRAAAGADVIVQRLMASCEYSRPLARGWTATAGVTWQRSGLRDETGAQIIHDAYGKPLTFSTTAQQDVMALGLLRLVYSGASESVLVLSAEQAVPLKPEWLCMTRLQARAEHTLRLAGPVRLALSAKAGLIEGDLPPYEAFPIGGTNSVRGYDEGAVGSGARYAVASAELHVPLVAPVAGVLFADVGSDLDTGHDVLGAPGSTRGKPGSGAGLGAGVRLDSPVGPLRLEYALSDRGARRFHFGIGKAF